MSDKDIEIKPVNMGQGMSVLSAVFVTYINAFADSAATEEEKTAISYAAISIFLFQFCMAAKYKDKMAGVLEAITVELKEEHAKSLQTPVE